FFFSSRRRHTRCLSDWSSDVCSSDLGLAPLVAIAGGMGERRDDFDLALFGASTGTSIVPSGEWGRPRGADEGASVIAGVLAFFQIGRASCRERGEVWGVGGVLNV